MSSVYQRPFELRDLDQFWVEARHIGALKMLWDHEELQNAVVGDWAVTFLDAKNDETLGCLGVLEETDECWAFMNKDTLIQRAYMPHRILITRNCNRILDAREKALKRPCVARVDGTDPRDEKFIRAIGFKPGEDGVFRRATWSA